MKQAAQSKGAAGKPVDKAPPGELVPALEALLGYRFADPALLTLAMTHRSHAFDAGLAGAARPADNEQLEFLGDAVLGLVAADALLRRFPAAREGELTRLRSSFVSRQHLGKVGTALDLGRWLRVGRTVEQGAGRSHGTLLANTVEALIAAVYLDGGMEPARAWIERVVLAGVEDVQTEEGVELQASAGATGDYKSELQERLQSAGGRAEYRMVAASGPDHRRVFHMEVWATGEPAPLGTGSGATKKQAEQQAAREALLTLDGREAGGPESGEPGSAGKAAAAHG